MLKGLVRDSAVVGVYKHARHAGRKHNRSFNKKDYEEASKLICNGLWQLCAPIREKNLRKRGK